MAAIEENEAKISVKVIVDKVYKRVVYAEADYTFVDILFSFMTLPIGTIVRILGKVDDKKFEGLGSLNNLYQSLKDFPDCYLSSAECKPILLNPMSLSYHHCRKLKLKIDDTQPLSYFGCTQDSMCITSLNSNIERYCRFRVAGCVFVSDIATIIISDNLCVEPYTSESGIRLLTDCGITDTSYLEERKLDMCSNEVLYFLKLALTVDNPFTYLVFSKMHPNQEIFSSCEESSFDQCDVLKKEVSATSTMLLKVFLQKSSGKLLFAETKEDFVEFLFGILSIPLGTVVGTLLNGASSISCMDNVFKSISNMSVGRYLMSQDIKDMLLKPHIGQPYSSKNQVFPLKCTPTLCEHVKDPRPGGNFLKQSGMFMVTDDLTITPSTSHSTIDVLRKLNVPLDDIERCEVSIGLEECLKLLKASLRSCSTLTDSLKHQLKK